ncbi:MAG: PIN domain-containing protein [Archaeoglobaceae archaeon]
MEANRGRGNRVAVIDTNVLMYVFLNRVDVISQLRELGFRRLIVPSSVVKELENLSRSLRGKEKRAALFALELIEREGIEVVEVTKRRDEAVLELAEKLGGCVITNDKSLKRVARERGLPVGTLREGSYIEVTEF